MKSLQDMTLKIKNIGIGTYNDGFAKAIIKKNTLQEYDSFAEGKMVLKNEGSANEAFLEMLLTLLEQLRQMSSENSSISITQNNLKQNIIHQIQNYVSITNSQNYSSNINAVLNKFTNDEAFSKQQNIVEAVTILKNELKKNSERSFLSSFYLHNKNILTVNSLNAISNRAFYNNIADEVNNYIPSIMSKTDIRFNASLKYFDTSFENISNLKFGVHNTLDNIIGFVSEDIYSNGFTNKSEFNTYLNPTEKHGEVYYDDIKKISVDLNKTVFLDEINSSDNSLLNYENLAIYNVNHEKALNSEAVSNKALHKNLFSNTTSFLHSLTNYAGDFFSENASMSFFTANNSSEITNVENNALTFNATRLDDYFRYNKVLNAETILFNSKYSDFNIQKMIISDFSYELFVNDLYKFSLKSLINNTDFSLNISKIWGNFANYYSNFVNNDLQKYKKHTNSYSKAINTDISLNAYSAYDYENTAINNLSSKFEHSFNDINKLSKYNKFSYDNLSKYSDVLLNTENQLERFDYYNSSTIKTDLNKYNTHNRLLNYNKLLNNQYGVGVNNEFVNSTNDFFTSFSYKMIVNSLPINYNLQYKNLYNNDILYKYLANLQAESIINNYKATNVSSLSRYVNQYKAINDTTNNVNYSSLKLNYTTKNLFSGIITDIIGDEIYQDRNNNYTTKKLFSSIITDIIGGNVNQNKYNNEYSNKALYIKYKNKLTNQYKAINDILNNVNYLSQKLNYTTKNLFSSIITDITGGNIYQNKYNNEYSNKALGTEYKNKLTDFYNTDANIFSFLNTNYDNFANSNSKLENYQTQYTKNRNIINNLLNQYHLFDLFNKNIKIYTQTIKNTENSLELIIKNNAYNKYSKVLQNEYLSQNTNIGFKTRQFENYKFLNIDFKTKSVNYKKSKNNYLNIENNGISGFNIDILNRYSKNILIKSDLAFSYNEALNYNTLNYKTKLDYLQLQQEITNNDNKQTVDEARLYIDTLTNEIITNNLHNKTAAREQNLFATKIYSNIIKNIDYYSKSLKKHYINSFSKNSVNNRLQLNYRENVYNANKNISFDDYKDLNINLFSDKYTADTSINNSLYDIFSKTYNSEINRLLKNYNGIMRIFNNNIALPQFSFYKNQILKHSNTSVFKNTIANDIDYLEIYSNNHTKGSSIFEILKKINTSNSVKNNIQKAVNNNKLSSKYSFDNIKLEFSFNPHDNIYNELQNNITTISASYKKMQSLTHQNLDVNLHNDYNINKMKFIGKTNNNQLENFSNINSTTHNTKLSDIENNRYFVETIFNQDTFVSFLQKKYSDTKNIDNTNKNTLYTLNNTPKSTKFNTNNSALNKYSNNILTQNAITNYTTKDDLNLEISKKNIFTSSENEFITETEKHTAEVVHRLEKNEDLLVSSKQTHDEIAKIVTNQIEEQLPEYIKKHKAFIYDDKISEKAEIGYASDKNNLSALGDKTTEKYGFRDIDKLYEVLYEKIERSIKTERRKMGM